LVREELRLGPGGLGVHADVYAAAQPVAADDEYHSVARVVARRQSCLYRREVFLGVFGDRFADLFDLQKSQVLLLRHVKGDQAQRVVLEDRPVQIIAAQRE
jgi:hypothetical protein